MTDSTAIAPRTHYDRLKSMLKAEDVQARFRDVLGDHTPQFIASLLSVVSANDSLRECDPGSILTSALKAAVLDLPIDPNIGFAWIIPYNSRDGKKAQFQVGYKGFIQLALRTNQYEAINAVEIYEGEKVKVDRLSGRIILNGAKTGDSVIGYVSYFKLLGGFEKFLYMTIDEIHAHAKKYSKSYGDAKGAWTTNFDGMAKKTVLKALLTRYGIMSVQMQKAIVSDRRLEEESEQQEPGDVILDARFSENDGPEAETSDNEAPSPAPLDPEPVVGKNGNGEIIAQLIAAAIERGYTENEFSAKKSLEKRKVDFANLEQGLTWFKYYRGWRDIGATSQDAAKRADEGKQP